MSEPLSKLQQIQTILGVTADGLWGAKSMAALDALLGRGAAGASAGPVADNSLDWRMDARSARNIASLLAPVQKLAREFLELLAQNGISAQVISGTRSYAEQDALYEQGRSRAGAVVTKARGGFSNHNFAVAFDIGIFDANSKYLEDGPAYAKAGALGKQLGLQWGGDWKSIQDEPHFEWRPAWAQDLTESDALAAYRERHEKGIPIA